MSDTGDEAAAFSISMREITLERGGKVAVGYSEDKTCTDMFIRFTDRAGELTKIRISDQATAALKQLLRIKRAGFSGHDALWMLVEYCAQGMKARQGGDASIAAPVEDRQPDGSADAP